MTFMAEFALPLVFLLIFMPYVFRVLPEYQRGVIYTLGRSSPPKGPGLIFLLPAIQRMVRVDMRVQTMNVPSQDVISRDNISVKVNAVMYYRVVDADKAINQVQDFNRATSELSQTTLRAVLGKHELDEMLSERDKLSTDIRNLLDEKTEHWGVKVDSVELKNIDIDPSMIHAIGRQAEAERERRAKIISAEGEQQAADKLVEAAQKLATDPGAMQLRYLAAVQDMADDKTKTILLPLPMEILKRLM
ncbi:MAG: slipin family protein [Alphaproteobacteria bacterium]|nr:slipin family protein [Alphaproteobacteria bacterium]MDE2336044.1 slipin family protein [Alphaproteobacteria bacterium]